MNRRLSTALFCMFPLVVVGVSLAVYHHYPVLVFSGEKSPVSWLSSVLLAVSAVLGILLGVRKEKLIFAVTAVLLFVCSADERFSFHEQIQDFLRFAGFGSLWMVPVIGAAAAGMIVLYLVSKSLRRSNQTILFTALAAGSISIVIDLLSMGVLWEDICKISAVYLLAVGLFRELVSEKMIN